MASSDYMYEFMRQVPEHEDEAYLKAAAAIVKAWDEWLPCNLPSFRDFDADSKIKALHALHFFADLERQRSPLLRFSGSPRMDFLAGGDPWQQVKCWLIAAGRIGYE
jgi:hypothetical protein